MAGDPQYDVAISFLAKDEVTAKGLADRLEVSGLKVFFFPRNQEELAGTNGMESMRQPFLSSRINTVLYRDGWGATPWTRVESTAIQEQCFNGGWNQLMFVTLGTPKEIPKWVPPMHIRFAFEQYGYDQLVGAIKLRIQEQGGTFVIPDAMSEARRVQLEQTFHRDRERLLRDAQFIFGVHNALSGTYAEIGRLVTAAKTEHGLEIEYRVNGHTYCVLRASFISLFLSWQQEYGNVVANDKNSKCFLRVAEFSGGVVCPGESAFSFTKPRLLKEHKFSVEIDYDRAMVWQAAKGERIAPKALADYIMRIFFDLLSRANAGKVSPPR